MSNEQKIITGLKLSEAIKYCEENEGALIKPGKLYRVAYKNQNIS